MFSRIKYIFFSSRIRTKKVPFPRTMDPIAKDFIDRLLNKNGKTRMGAKGVEEIKTHKFFSVGKVRRF